MRPSTPAPTTISPPTSSSAISTPGAATRLPSIIAAVTARDAATRERFAMLRRSISSPNDRLPTALADRLPRRAQGRTSRCRSTAADRRYVQTTAARHRGTAPFAGVTEKISLSQLAKPMASADQADDMPRRSLIAAPKGDDMLWRLWARPITGHPRCETIQSLRSDRNGGIFCSRGNSILRLLLGIGFRAWCCCRHCLGYFSELGLLWLSEKFLLLSGRSLLTCCGCCGPPEPATRWLPVGQFCSVHNFCRFGTSTRHQI